MSLTRLIDLLIYGAFQIREENTETTCEKINLQDHISDEVTVVSLQLKHTRFFTKIKHMRGMKC